MCNTIYGFNSNFGWPYLSVENADDPMIFVFGPRVVSIISIFLVIFKIKEAI